VEDERVTVIGHILERRLEAWLFSGRTKALESTDADIDSERSHVATQIFMGA
jgi:hypothetical protein